METSLRLILLCIGFVIIAGIFWDVSRNKKKARKPLKSAKSKTSVSNGVKVLDSDHEYINEDEDDHVYVQDRELLQDREPLIGSEEDLTNETNIIVSDEVVPVSTPMSSKETNLNTKKDTEIMAIMVMARQPGYFLGKRLLEAFQELHLHFGARQIFHRYENQDGTGHKVFSVTSAVEPGVFNLSKMDTFKTPGILLFFPLNHPNQAIAAFEQMLRTAKLLCMRLDGELKDERRRPLTNHMIEQYREKVRNLSFA